MPNLYPAEPTVAMPLRGLVEDASTAESLASREERLLAEISDAIDSLLPESMRRAKTRHRRNPR